MYKFHLGFFNWDILLLSHCFCLILWVWEDNLKFAGMNKQLEINYLKPADLLGYIASTICSEKPFSRLEKAIKFTLLYKVLCS